MKGLAEEQGFKVLTHRGMGFAQITNNIRSIHAPKDFKEVKMLSPDEPSSIETFNHLGASVSTMALQRCIWVYNKELSMDNHPTTHDIRE